MRTWVLCLVVGLVCLIAVSIATLILQLPPDLFNSTNADPDDGPRLQSDQGKRQELSFVGLNGDTVGAIEEEGGNVAVQSLLDPQTTRLSSGSLPERDSPDSKDSGRDRFGNHNNLETNLQEPAVVDIILQTGDELLPPPPPSLPTTTEDGRPLVFTTTGKVAGFKREILGKKLNVFLGIPYATPPVGDLRFRKPQPIQPWSDVYDASDMGPPCFHITYSSSWSWAASRKTESEDCLHLNVWAPEALRQQD
ncbi:acetylcholinesterase, putative [Ixodes scapularis]|uniref:Acetylcholinesterase, putative n=1 Tax=Ixodes scapularis TaxID=6945 RepID=B7Q9J1_IXOSC|nr:acetylcholinesterase, putative [Ixodes scapularis]|eukprot:XP_002412505.1 acetylcholinesterase, putative [Ixodes scapularis]